MNSTMSLSTGSSDSKQSISINISDPYTSFYNNKQINHSTILITLIFCCSQWPQAFYGSLQYSHISNIHDRLGQNCPEACVSFLYRFQMNSIAIFEPHTYLSFALEVP